MKTPVIHSLSLLSLTLLLGSSAFAGDSKVVAIDHGRGTTYSLRNVGTPATIALSVNGRGVGRVQTTQANEKEYVWKTGQFGNGPFITYLAPRD